MHVILRPDQHVTDALALLKVLDAIGEHADLSGYAEVKAARAQYLVCQAISAARAETTGSGEQIINDVATALAAGKLDARQVRDAAVTAHLVGDRSSALNAIYSLAEMKAAGAMGRHLAGLGDRWVTEILRPVVDRLTVAIMAAVPRPETIHPADPSSADRLSVNDEARDAHAALRELHGYANYLREYRIIPATRRRTDAWEWATPSGSRGTTEDKLVHFVAHTHAGHGPGIFTEAEVRDAEQPAEVA